MISASSLEKINFYRAHIFAWFLFITFEFLLSFSLSLPLGSAADYILGYVLNIVLFYTNSHIVWPIAYKKPIYIGIALILLELIAYLIMRYAFALFNFGLGLSAYSPSSLLTLSIIARMLYRFIYFVGISSGYWFALNIIAQRKKISDLENSKLLNQLQQQQLEKKLVDSEVAYLKSQINPHFLFNTLNFLHNTALQQLHNYQPILLLSDIMRYALTEIPQNGKVELSEEIEQIASLLI